MALLSGAPLKRKNSDMKNSPLLDPNKPWFRSSKKHPVPQWETTLVAAIGDGLIAKDVFKTSSAIHSNLTSTSEFELPGEILVRFESRPSPSYSGAVNISIVVAPNPHTELNQRPCEVLPIMTPKGLRQGQVTALATIHFGERGPPYITLLYVNRFFPERWRHVCGV